MPSEGILTVPQGIWYQITPKDSTTITLFHRGGAEVVVMATDGKVRPPDPGPGELPVGIPLLSGFNQADLGFLKEPIQNLSHVPDAKRVFLYAVEGEAKVYFQADG